MKGRCMSIWMDSVGEASVGECVCVCMCAYTRRQVCRSQLHVGVVSNCTEVVKVSRTSRLGLKMNNRVWRAY